MDSDMVKLGDSWEETGKEVGFHFGGGYNKVISVRTKYDGNGNAVVRFVVKNNGKETTFEKFDSAVTYYNSLK